MAAALKDKGNAAFAAKNFAEAIDYFTQAIDVDGTNHVLWSNRSAAQASLGRYDLAKDDARKCVELNPQWAKGYIRLGQALHGLKEYAEAVAAYEEGLKVDPQNATLTEALAAVKKDMSGAGPFGGIFGPDTFTRVQSSPALSPYLMQPDYVQMLNHCISNPSMAQMFMKDQRMMMTFLHLSGVDLSAMGGERDTPQGGAPETTEAQSRKTPAPTPEEPKPSSPPVNAEAQSHKEKGNALYRERRFEEALLEYDEALRIEPTNTTFLLNRTAVFFEQGEFEKCIAGCDAAIDHGRDHQADYKVVAKLMSRKALCLQRLQRYEEAIALFKKSLVEDRNADTLAKLNNCEKEKKQAEEEAYLNPEIARAKKEEGNAFFKAQKYPEAVEAYTESVKRNPKEHTTYSNRAAAYLKLCAYNEALKDCEKCIELEPTFTKAYARKGHAYYWTKQYHKALQAYDEGLRLDSNNSECVDGKATTMRKIQEMQSSGDEEAAQRAMADPEIASIMQDTYMQMVLREMQNDPKRAQEYLADPGISAKINKLIAAGIIRVGGAAPPRR